MKVLVVLNASSGSLIDRSLPEVIDEIERGFAAAGVAAEVSACTGPELAPTFERAARSDIDALVVGGGDGTIATAAQALAGSAVAMGILPLGTANLLARDLDIPLDQAAAIAVLAAGRIRAIDLAEVNGRVFLNASVLGMLPRLAARREKHRGRMTMGRWWSIILGAFRSLRRYPRLKLAIVAGTGVKRLRVHSLMVTDNLYDCGFAAGRTRTRLDGGRLGIYIARHRSPLGLIRLAWKMLIGTWQSDQELDVIEATRLAVVTRKKRLRVAIDGEIALVEPPLRYRIRPGALRVLAGEPPAAATEEAEVEPGTACAAPAWAGASAGTGTAA